MRGFMAVVAAVIVVACTGDDEDKTDEVTDSVTDATTGDTGTAPSVDGDWLGDCGLIVPKGYTGKGYKDVYSASLDISLMEDAGKVTGTGDFSLSIDFGKKGAKDRTFQVAGGGTIDQDAALSIDLSVTATDTKTKKTKKVDAFLRFEADLDGDDLDGVLSIVNLEVDPKTKKVTKKVSQLTFLCELDRQ